MCCRFVYASPRTCECVTKCPEVTGIFQLQYHLTRPLLCMRSTLDHILTWHLMYTEVEFNTKYQVFHGLSH
jgi:hypothetical protein